MRDILHSPFVIESSFLKNRDEQAILTLLNRAKTYARPPISEFYVGVVAIGESGTGYLGVNLEFPHQPLSQTVHAEQFAITLAKLHGEKKIQALWVSEVPCGHCRQFLLELNLPNLPIIVVQQNQRLEKTLSDLLPFPFTLANSAESLLETPPSMLTTCESITDTLVSEAFNAASLAYVPYTKQYAGMALKMSNGEIFKGFSVESAAYNPTLPALQAAMIHLVSQNQSFQDIQEAVLLEMVNTQVSSAPVTENVLKTLAPQATFKYLPILALAN